MNVRAGFFGWSNFFRLSNGVRILALTGILLGVLAGATLAAGPPTTPAAFFNFASVIGLNKSVTATRVPIQTSTGAIIYKDVTINVNVDASGNLTYATTTPMATLSPTLSSSNFRAGIYTDSQSSVFGIQVSGPAPIGGGGEAQWSLTPAASLNCDRPTPATFYTGPSLDSANSALAARVKAAGITATQFSFGVVGQPSCNNTGNNWDQDALIGVTTVGSQLMVSSFTPANGTDSNTPVQTVIYNLSE